MTENNKRREWSRRDSLRLFAGGVTVAALAELPKKALAGVTNAALSLEEVMKLSPTAVAERSEIVVASYRYLLNAADEISDPALRQSVAGILKTPSALVMERLNSDGAKEEVRAKLAAAGLLKPEATVAQVFPVLAKATEPAQPFIVAPGSGYASHHAYPGGLAVHVALNVHASLGLYAGYRDTFGLGLSRDVVLASQLLHDLHKPWVFQWKADGSLLAENTIAGTGAHHILSVAESIHRGLPADVIIAQASAHDHPGDAASEGKVVGYLKAAAIIAGKDPLQLGLLSAGGETIKTPRAIEPFITHIGDHDFIVAMPANTWTLPLLKEVAAKDYGMREADLAGEAFNKFRNFVYANVTMIGLHQTNVTGGADAVRGVVRALIRV